MPRGRGGRRQGTPGKAYSNRTDLAVDYSPATGMTTPASGGVQAPAPATFPTPDQVPRLDDPTANPAESVLAGLSGNLPSGGDFATDPAIDELRAVYARYPTPQLARVLAIVQNRYGTL